MTPAQPPHGRKLGIPGTSLTKVRLNKHGGKALNLVRDSLEQLLVESCFLDDAPFSWVTVSIRYGLKNEDAPHYEKINKRYGDLTLAIEVDTHELISATMEELTLKFKVAALKALIHAGRKYERPTEQLEAELTKLNVST
jgi:hypothetical protein